MFLSLIVTKLNHATVVTVVTVMTVVTKKLFSSKNFYHHKVFLKKISLNFFFLKKKNCNWGRKIKTPLHSKNQTTSPHKKSCNISTKKQPLNQKNPATSKKIKQPLHHKKKHATSKKHHNLSTSFEVVLFSPSLTFFWTLNGGRGGDDQVSKVLRHFLPKSWVNIWILGL